MQSTNNDTIEDKNICNTIGPPSGMPDPGNLSWLYLQSPLTVLPAPDPMADKTIRILMILDYCHCPDFECQCLTFALFFGICGV